MGRTGETPLRHTGAALLKEGDAVMATFVKLIEEFDDSENQDYDFLQPTIRLLKSRQVVLSMVMATPTEEKPLATLRAQLADYIKGFEKAELAKDKESKASTDIASAPCTLR